MSQNPREPSQPAGDNPAGRTRGQTHRFQLESHLNPNLTSDLGRPPIPISSITAYTADKFNTMVSTSDNIKASYSIASISDPFVKSGSVHRSPQPTTSEPNPALNSVTDIPSDLDRNTAGSSVLYKKGTHSARTDSGATSTDRENKELREREELRSAHRKLMDKTATALREALEGAEKIHCQSQREYEAFQRKRQERAAELQNLNLALGRRKDEVRKLESERLDFEMARARLEEEAAEADRVRVESERAKVVAERAREEAEQELRRVKSELQRAESVTSFQRVYPSGPSITAADLGRAPGPNPLFQFPTTSATAFQSRSKTTGRWRTSLPETNLVDSNAATIREATQSTSRIYLSSSRSYVTTNFQLPAVNLVLTFSTFRETPAASKELRDIFDEELLALYARMERLRL